MLSNDVKSVPWSNIIECSCSGVMRVLPLAIKALPEFDAGVPKKFVIDPHKLFSAA
jgi:hypothetical protein